MDYSAKNKNLDKGIKLKDIWPTNRFRVTMSEELPILKGILKGNVSYHNARRFKFFLVVIALIAINPGHASENVKKSVSIVDETLTFT